MAYEITAEMHLKNIIAESREVAQALNEFADTLESIQKKYEESEGNTNIRNCFGCKYSKDNHNAGTEECHLCMWENQYTPTTELELLEKTYTDFINSEGGEGWLRIDGKEYSTDVGYAIEGLNIFMEVFKRRLAEKENNK